MGLIEEEDEISKRLIEASQKKVRKEEKTNKKNSDANNDKFKIDFIEEDKEANFANVDKMKVHRGPVNISSVFKKDPNTVWEEILFVLKSLNVSYKIGKPFSAKCNARSLKFTVEINIVENLKKVFVVKFIKGSKIDLIYIQLCSRIIGALSLK